MSSLIDTNIAIYLTDGRKEVRDRIEALDAPPVISLITLIELEGGVYVDPDLVALRRLRLDGFLAWVTVLPCDAEVVQAYAGIVARLGFSRPRLLDRLIAATAITVDVKLITSNGTDFRDIPNLKLEVWPAPVQ